MISPASRRRLRIKAAHPGTCSCGATFLTGEAIDWMPATDQMPARVAGCTSCGFTGRARATQDLNWKAVAAALRRRRAKEAKRRAAAGGKP